jgi:intracellular sulfur oxidation DsrE/DsrF family protein
MKISKLLISTLLCAFALSLHAAEIIDDRPVIGITKKSAIKVVFALSSGDLAGDVGKGLTKLDKIWQDYLDAGVSPAEIDLHVVIHGDAADQVLTDDAWDHRRNATTGNPNTTLVNSLIKRGVHLELCNGRRLKNGWEKSEIHPDVPLVGNAYLRLADLQLQGYATIKL